MEEEEKMELVQKVNSFNAPFDAGKSIVDNAIDNQVKEPMTIKEAIDLEATKSALKQEDTTALIVQTKGQELFQDAQKKLTDAEKKRIDSEKEKELAYLQKQIETLEKEKKQLEVENDKASQFYDNHKAILKCIGIREKLGLKAMQMWLVPASVIYGIFQILLLPVTICGFLIEQVMNILSAICEKMKNNAFKIIISILTVLVIVGVVVGCYWLIAHCVR